MKLWAQHKKLLSIHARIISRNNTVEIASNITKYVRAMTFLAQIVKKCFELSDVQRTRIKFKKKTEQ